MQDDLQGVTHISLNLFFDPIKSEPGQNDHQHYETASQND
jgi:hypothetical protein